MITKAIIIDKLDNKYKVRIPLFDGVTDGANKWTDDLLDWATVIMLRNINNPFSIGDVVYVSFEQNDYGRPVILGGLYLENKDLKTGNELDMFIRNLETTGVTKLIDKTWIGDTRPQDFKNLQNTKENLQAQIDELKLRLEKAGIE